MNYSIFKNGLEMIVHFNGVEWNDRKSQLEAGETIGIKYNSTEEFDNSTRFKLNAAKRFLRSIGR